MAALEIKSVRIGHGVPKTIVPLMGATVEDLTVEAKRAVDAGADIVEWRVDHFRQGAVLVADTARTLADILPATPIVATVRTKGQGGEMALDARSYAALCTSLADADAIDILDVELCWGDELVAGLVGHAHENGLSVIVSEHDFESTPPTADMVETLFHMAELEADIAKIAVWATSPADACRLMEATACAHERLDMPLITMAMGAHGVISRLAGEAFGSAATFCALDRPSAPGQVGLAEARSLITGLSGVLGAPAPSAQE